jgi:3-deoxy-7-phosphoheptulonate synthase
VIIVLKPDSTSEQVDHIVDRIHQLGLKTDVSRGIKRTIIGVIGDEDILRNAPLQAIPGVEEVVPILKPYKLASREYQAEDSSFEVGFGVRVGGGHLAMIAGPCAIEGRDILFEIAQHVKPRTSPYSFQGLGEEGLRHLREVGDELTMPVCTEVMDPRQVALVDKYTDIFQIGARNMQNFNLLSEVGQTKRPVLLKRGMSASVTDLLMSAEYIMAGGNKRVILCERGIKSFDNSTRNLLDLSIVPNSKGLSHLPIIVDPSHGTGRPDLIPPMALASIAAGADGVHIEVHSCPEKALSDGPQALLPWQYQEVMDRMRQIASLFGKDIPQPHGARA